MKAIVVDKILLIGCGAVAKTTLLYWSSIIPEIKYRELIVIEPVDIHPDILKFVTKHIKDELTPTNYQDILNNVKPNFVLDLSVYVFSISIINWCTFNNVPYLSTALEEWEDAHEWTKESDTYLSSLLYLQRSCLQLNQQQNHHPTVLIDHGMNPGLVSHFTKIGIEKLAVEEGIKYKTHGEAAMKLGIQTIHCSEVDTQETIYDENGDDDVFYNTWSSIGYFEEGTLPTQMGWGSHEPKLDLEHDVDAEQVFLRQYGIETFVKGYNPIVKGKNGSEDGYYYGRCIPHGEGASIPRYLTFGKYRPSCYYVYKSSPVSQKSLENLKKNDYDMLPRYLVVNTDEIIGRYDPKKKKIVYGADAVGALFIRKDKSLYWAGTIIRKDDVPEEFREHVNPTCVQVACGVLSGIDYVLRHPGKGVIFPEDVESKRVMQLTQKYLGEVIFSKMPGKLPSDFKSLLKR